jgi:hypothetical protein
VWGSQRKRYRDLWNKIGNPEIDLHKYAQLLFLQRYKITSMEGGELFNKKKK